MAASKRRKATVERVLITLAPSERKRLDRYVAIRQRTSWTSRSAVIREAVGWFLDEEERASSAAAG